MKNDLATAIGAAITGFLIAFFVTNYFIGGIQDVTVKTVDSNVNTSLSEPNPEIFNYRALNPTVEVYVGSCIKYDSNGECAEILVEEDAETPIEDTEVNQEN